MIFDYLTQPTQSLTATQSLIATSTNQLHKVTQPLIESSNFNQPIAHSNSITYRK